MMRTMSACCFTQSANDPASAIAELGVAGYATNSILQPKNGPSRGAPEFSYAWEASDSIAFRAIASDPEVMLLRRNLSVSSTIGEFKVSGSRWSPLFPPGRPPRQRIFQPADARRGTQRGHGGARRFRGRG